MTGAKGGEQIREILVVRVVSVSILNKAEKITWKNKAPNVATVVNKNIFESMFDRVLRLTCEATAIENTIIK